MITHYLTGQDSFTSYFFAWPFLLLGHSVFISTPMMSLATSVKDYVEITHKLIEIEPLKNYTEFGAVFTYFIFSVGDFFKNFFSFSLVKNIWSIPIIIPDIASAMISEISVLDGYFHNAFTFLETNVNTANVNNQSLVIFEKFIIGLINSFFLFLPTSTSHLITLRRFVMQGLEAGYFAGLGTLAGNFLWLASVILGWRFFVIPWLSLDIFRYLLGFILLVKYIWDSSKEKRMALEDLSKWKIFLLNFLLALTEQSCIYPFITNLSIGPETSILEGFPVDNYAQFLAVHGAYLVGILFGSFSLLQFTCWFWENPAFSIYLWITTKSSLKISTSSYYKILNFTFLYSTMLCAIASIPYYGLDYTITNPIGLVPQDRILDQKKSQSDPDKLITETAFLNGNPTDKNSRIRDGVHARRDRWRQRLIKYQAFDAKTYDQGVYDFLTIEDLNYGFDRFWLRRKMRNHQIRFRLFPGPWMRSLKKQLNNPSNQSLENSTKSLLTTPRVEFFRILFEQFYHPNFHAKEIKSGMVLPGPLNNLGSVKNSPNFNYLALKKSTSLQAFSSFETKNLNKNLSTIETLNNKIIVKPGLIYKNSALRKFVRNVNTRINLKLITTRQYNPSLINKYNKNLIYSKRWKSIFSKLQPITKTSNHKSYQLFRNVSKRLLTSAPNFYNLKALNFKNVNKLGSPNLTTLLQLEKLSTREQRLLNLQLNQKAPYIKPGGQKVTNDNLILIPDPLNNLGTPVLHRPLNVYLQKEQAFKRKLRYYGAAPIRKLTVGNQAPYFKAVMKRGFYYYKPTLRWKKTLYVASMRRGFRKKSRKPLSNLSLNVNTNNAPSNLKDPGNVFGVEAFNNTNTTSLSASNGPKIFPGSKESDRTLLTTIVPPTHSYTVLGKRASRYRHQIYKDVLQHWYYTPFNRLLLKFDVDAFINRQPKSHFLTKNEERLLHLRRFLLSEHYDTLRWYTYMQHYRTMKANIGGTKSLASRTYNQQFQGTFKKVRHLFLITPKQGDLYTLKFDQPLYNDNKIKDSIYFHEELLADNSALNDKVANKIIWPKSNETVLVPSASSNYSINPLISNSQFSPSINSTDSSLAQTIENSPKGPIIKPGSVQQIDLITKSNDLIGQQYLNPNITNGTVPNDLYYHINPGPKEQENQNFVYNELFIKLIKECKKRIQDQTFLKNYITHRIEKRDQLNQENLSALNKRLEKLKLWLNAPGPLTSLSNNETNKENKTLTTGMQKALNDSVKVDKIQGTSSSLALITKSYNQRYPGPFIHLGTRDSNGQQELNNTFTLKIEEDILNKLNLIDNIAQNQIKKGTTFKKRQEIKTLLKIKTKFFLHKLMLFTITRKLQVRTDKNLEWWRKKERVITKRKNSRKRDRFKKQIAVINKKLATRSKKVEQNVSSIPILNTAADGPPGEKSTLYKTLYGNFDISDYLLKINTSAPAAAITDSSVLRKKNTFASGEEVGLKQNNFAENTSIWQVFFNKKLRKKVSSKGRRYRSLSLARYLTATRKPRLIFIDNLTKIDNITNLNGSFITKDEKNAYLNKTINTELLTNLKSSQIKKRSRHSWKKRARHQFNRNHYKYRKRHIHGNGKLRVMNKKLKKFKATNELRQWWWSSFLPRYLNNLSRLNGVEKHAQRHSASMPGRHGLKTLLPGANGSLITVEAKNLNERNETTAFKPLSNINLNTITLSGIFTPEGGMLQTNNNLFNSTSSVNTPALVTNQTLKPIQLDNLNTTSLPFYAGWDESVRKFVITNRLLSRRDTGLSIIQNKSPENNNTNNFKKSTPVLPRVFSNTPIQGLNEGSFLYWQTEMPFNTYNIDQFITTNQSFYAPLGWRRFEFRHSILKTWTTNLIKQSINFSTRDYKGQKDAIAQKIKTDMNKTLIVSIKNLNPGPGPLNNLGTLFLKETIKDKKAVARRIKKRYKLIKQMPNQLMYTPTGPLLTEVLPSHYISVFDQQYRFPRNRYLKRNPLKTLKKTTLLSMVDTNKNSTLINKDFTLRKRVKPRRKYHRKRFIKKDGLIFPRRMKFTTNTLSNLQAQLNNKAPTKLTDNLVGAEEQLRWRPIYKKSKQKRKETGRSKIKSNKRVKTNPLRLRQLRRREFQQILKPVQRYIPRNGGFTWPGDYLRLEIVEMPKLKEINIKKTSLKQKITVQPVGIMPRKYLIEKHNIKVLKKKLEKAYNTQNLTKTVEHYKNLLR